MKRVVAAGFLLVIAVQLAAAALPDQRFVLGLSGVAVAVVLLALRWLLANDIGLGWTKPVADEREKSLRRWISRTETLIGWSESTRGDWDRHLRSKLALQFELATGQRRAKDPVAYQATGRMLFGPELWRWVDPENVARTGRDQPGPGRAALEQILRRLEQV